MKELFTKEQQLEALTQELLETKSEHLHLKTSVAKKESELSLMHNRFSETQGEYKSKLMNLSLQLDQVKEQNFDLLAEVQIERVSESPSPVDTDLIEELELKLKQKQFVIEELRKENLVLQHELREQRKLGKLLQDKISKYQQIPSQNVDYLLFQEQQHKIDFLQQQNKKLNVENLEKERKIEAISQSVSRSSGKETPYEKQTKLQNMEIQRLKALLKQKDCEN